MLLKNGKNVFIAILNNLTQFDFIWEAGNIASMNSNPNVMLKNVSSTGKKGYSFFVVGNGTTPENEMDYKLENELTSLTVDSFTMNLVSTSNDGKLNEKISYRASVTNNTSSNVTISEIGIKYWYDSALNILWYRKTFEPITLAPNETYTFAVDLM